MAAKTKAVRRKKAVAGPVAGPEVRAGGAGAAVAMEKKVEKPLRPSQCEKYLRKAVAAAFPQIVGGFVGEAKRGGCQHLRVAVEIVKTTGSRTARAPRPGAVGLLMEKYGGEFKDPAEANLLRMADAF